MFLEVAIAVSFFGITMYTANQVQIRAWQPAPLRLMLYSAAMLMFFMAFLPLQFAFLDGTPLPPEVEIAMPEVSMTAATAVLIFGIMAAGVSLAIVHSQQARLHLRNLIGNQGDYDPDSVVHITAVVLVCLLLISIIATFVASGGLPGLAESIESTGIDLNDTLITMVLEVTAAVLGVGYAIRRNGAQTLQRLGLKPPTRDDFIRGILLGLAFYGISVIFGVIYQQFTAPEELQEQVQAAEQLTRVFSPLPIALLVSMAAAVGEEIFIRGALQPIFGIWLSSGFFALLHTQYLITPILVLIFGLSICFGYIRRRYSTTTAIIAHFTYNFVPLFLLSALGTMS